MFIEIRPSRLTDAEGKLTGFRGVAVDITERKRAELALRESEEKFRSFVETSPDMIWEIDLQGKFRYISPTVLPILGYPPEAVIGRSITDLVADQSRAAAAQALAHDVMSAENPLPRLEIPARHRDGHEVILEIRPAFTGTDGRRDGLRGVAVDITERKRAEETIRKANRQLTLLGGITRHDILNKVAVAHGFLKIAGMKTGDPAAMAEYLAKTEAAIADIREQIGFTRIYENLGTQKPQWILLDDAIRRIQVPATISLHSTLQGISVYADPMLERVFFNLLDNSVRHGQRVTGIRVSSRRSGDDLVIVWEDNGVGIAADEKERIFERGFGKNTGLGMFLVREILSLTGIAIAETGKPGTGARFEIVVPEGGWLAAEPEDNPPGSSRPPAGS
jgi:PAS domain S-box-containing protein